VLRAQTARRVVPTKNAVLTELVELGQPYLPFGDMLTIILSLLSSVRSIRGEPVESWKAGKLQGRYFNSFEFFDRTRYVADSSDA